MRRRLNHYLVRAKAGGFPVERCLRRVGERGDPPPLVFLCPFSPVRRQGTCLNHAHGPTLRIFHPGFPVAQISEFSSLPDKTAPFISGRRRFAAPRLKSEGRLERSVATMVKLLSASNASQALASPFLPYSEPRVGQRPFFFLI